MSECSGQRILEHRNFRQPFSDNSGRILTLLRRIKTIELNAGTMKSQIYLVVNVRKYRIYFGVGMEGETRTAGFLATLSFRYVIENQRAESRFSMKQFTTLQTFRQEISKMQDFKLDIARLFDHLNFKFQSLWYGLIYAMIAFIYGYVLPFRRCHIIPAQGTRTTEGGHFFQCPLPGMGRFDVHFQLRPSAMEGPSDNTAGVADENAMLLEFEGVVIAGGGIAGLSTALALHRVGLKSLVLERGSTLRATGASLNLWTNAWRALHVLGISDDLRATHFRLEGAQIVSPEDGVNTQVSYRGRCKRDHEVRCVKRGVLLETLAAALPAETIRYNSKVVDIRTDSSNFDFPTVVLDDGTYIKAKVLIGCDGVNSIVSEWLGVRPAKHLGRSTSRGLSTYPEGHDFVPKFYVNLQNGIRAGYIPIDETDVFWYLNRKSLPQDSETAQEPKLIIQEALDFLRDFPEEYHDIVKRTLPNTASLAPIRYRCPWAVLVGRLSKGTVTIAGDAMHAMTPYIGQGGCSTLEDAVVLGRCLAEGMNGEMTSSTEEERKRIEEALKKYVEERRWRVSLLMTQSYVAGLLQPGSGRFAKFLREKVMTKVFGGALSHAEYDCGGLFDTMK